MLGNGLGGACCEVGVEAAADVVAADANDQLLPVAFAIVESENTSSWL